ncbi:MAG: hypothetical protein C3F13_11395 [Anaerolineales bacterium]|nr:MAG: hypothetical protein C3F13_11395 [Anaerolineales bacterium]
MTSISESIEIYKRQLEQGDIQKAYRGIMDFILALRTYFQNRYPDYYVSGGIYYGYMDMTYFSFSPRPIRDKNLRIAIVFLHENFRFEAWLAGVNKKVQSEYWKLIKGSGWDKYSLVPTIKGADAIVEHILVKEPDFSKPEELTKIIERETLQFIHDIEVFLDSKE